MLLYNLLLLLIKQLFARYLIDSYYNSSLPIDVVYNLDGFAKTKSCQDGGLSSGNVSLNKFALYL